MAEITYTEPLVTTVCWCGINLAVPRNLLRNAKENGDMLHCPLGHKFGWHETEAQKLRKQLEKAEESKAWWQQRQRAERELREDTERRLSAQKGATTRARKRAGAGVCPCCKRSFSNLTRHMHTKHPDFRDEGSDTKSDPSTLQVTKP